MKLFLSLFCFLLLCSPFSHATQTLPENAQAEAVPNPQSQQPPMYLFVQTAGTGTIEAIAGKDNTFKITLKQVNPYATYFAERPAKKAGFIPIQKFLSLWAKKEDNKLGANAPNAFFHAMHAEQGKEDKVLNVALELAEPVYDSATQTLTYLAKPLNASSMPMPTSNTPVKYVTLFVDDGPCIGCW